MVGCSSISLVLTAPVPHKHNADRRHHIPKMSFKVQNWPAYEAGQPHRVDRGLSAGMLADTWAGRPGSVYGRGHPDQPDAAHRVQAGVTADRGPDNNALSSLVRYPQNQWITWWATHLWCSGKSRKPDILTTCRKIRQCDKPLILCITPSLSTKISNVLLTIGSFCGWLGRTCVRPRLQHDVRQVDLRHADLRWRPAEQ